MRKVFVLLLMFAPGVQAFEVMPMSPFGGGYDKRTNLSLEDIAYLEERKAGVCVARGRQALGREGFPVHEAITRDAYKSVHGQPLTTASWVTPLLAGSIWNDDPEYLMRKAFFYGGFGKFARFRKIIDSGDGTATLTGRSHFGDLQYLHAMSPRTAGRVASEEETRAAIHSWMQAAYAVSTGETPYSTPIAETWFGKAFGELHCTASPGAGAQATECTVRDLFDLGHFWRDEANTTPAEITRQLALGAMLHTVQDSFSRSHAQRDESEANWPVVRFYSYPNELHCVHDMALKANRASIDKAAEYSRALMSLSARKAPWPEVAPLLDEIFGPSPAN